MPSYLHELLVLLLRNRSTSAAELLRQFDMQVPEYDKVRVDSADLNDVQPAELSRDEDKRYSWPPLPSARVPISTLRVPGCTLT